ncbi:hypothetical protein PPL_00492 [Heterostelium album PN500]|uniref:Glycoside hydrolase family 57 N-terminal domain-containing protein n=1 Tax=Heterostelium pallidum (strain ATCC 26659 / Pp 5 / PN500) TaxID=670386 RepID=D3AWL7_HETP5|nr:hypothetical protein PPL_00492 [Heterostelium album PN500]EFA86690.1 hypothetical protein PPL_00492 [Heterostelium album PN500]|eukprot:XP_020438794.1 hypothetical protein PPL_00492 [Heterostelium album PN500]
MPILFAFSPWADIGHDEPAYKLSRLMDKCLWFEHEQGGYGIPISWALSGQTMEAIVRTDDSIKGSIRMRTAKKGVFSAWEQSEIIGSTFHASGLAHPCLDDPYQDAYINGFVKEDIRHTNYVLNDLFDRQPRGFCPSEKLFSIQSSRSVVEEGYEYCIVGGEHFGGDSHGQYNKGMVFSLENGLKVLPTANEIMPSDFNRYHKAELLIDEIISYARRNNIGRVLLSADVDFWLDDNGFERIKWLFLKARERSDEIKMVNASALVESAWCQGYAGLVSLERFYQSIGITDINKYISTWTNAAGNLQFIDWQRSARSAEFIKAHTDRYFRGINNEQWVDGWKLQRSKEMWMNISGTVFYDGREQWYNFMPDCFDENMNKAWNLLNES